MSKETYEKGGLALKWLLLEHTTIVFVKKTRMGHLSSP